MPRPRISGWTARLHGISCFNPLEHVVVVPESLA
ncbi:hypothetical protein NP493_351g00081 [Ridgeia piscesae]|uniref:Uncharacterized protein n=1 Tax=Ridgeia piscesae TaxID=27915 RepID=A0AAD9NU49_RIDPI|nr:hypothetical protein NP493_351g00081 [Ridgeia piscesae]